MIFPSKETVDHVRQMYPSGTRVALVTVDDPYTTLQAGDRGTVDTVDDTATVFVNWDNGSTLGAVYGEDAIRKLTHTEIVKEQARLVANSGRTNMFDVGAVLSIALELDYMELADLIATDTKGYAAFILTGELDEITHEG